MILGPGQSLVPWLAQLKNEISLKFVWTKNYNLIFFLKYFGNSLRRVCEVSGDRKSQDNNLKAEKIASYNMQWRSLAEIFYLYNSNITCSH